MIMIVILIKNNSGKLGKIEEFYSQMEILEWELSDLFYAHRIC